MKKNRLAELMAFTQSLPSVDDVKLEPTPTQEYDEDGNPVKFRARTGPASNYYTTNLEAKAENLEKMLNEARALNAAVYIQVEKIVPNPWQPRLVFNDDELTLLEDSIRAVGVLQPIAVRKHSSEEGMYELVAGERRTRAAKAIGLSEIPAVVLDLSNIDMAAHAITENVVRANLTDYEIGIALAKLQKEFPSKISMANTFGINRTSLYRLLSFEKLPQVVLDKLATNQGLLNGHASYALVRFLEKENLSDDILVSLLEELEEGALQSNDIDEKLLYLVKAKQESDDTKKPTRLKKSVLITPNGKRVGSIDKTSTNFVLKIKLDSFGSSQEAQLLEVLQKTFLINQIKVEENSNPT